MTPIKVLMHSPIVIQSHGMGVESAAITLRWLSEATSRDFDLSDLIVITAQTGDEHQDSIDLMEQYQLPLMLKHKIRFVELARAGHLEEAGIVVLQDTREPVKMHMEGAYKLSDELKHAGTVPQFGGEHRCALKFKAFVIENWLSANLGHQAHPIRHAFGYNADELSRIKKSQEAFAERAKLATPSMAFGFNSEEPKRIERSKAYDSNRRVGIYPLQEWGWGREACLHYIKGKTGVEWRKSACVYCPFNNEAAKATDYGLRRFAAHADQSAQAMLVEYISLCMNPRGTLYRDRTLQVLMDDDRTRSVQKAFAKLLDEYEWALYKVRRMYTAIGKAARSVQRIEVGTRSEIQAKFNEVGLPFETQHGILYKYFARRKPDSYPTVEGFWVMAPKTMDDKVRGPISVFNQRWDKLRKQSRSLWD